jgi:hypothetical protein
MGVTMMALVKQSLTFWQTPAVQIPLAQVVPHVPQFFGSAAMSAHTVPQAVRPLGHWQTPDEHVAVSGQAVPQPDFPQ